MKVLRIFHRLFGFAVVALPCFLVWSHYQERREYQEAMRIEASQEAVGKALENFRAEKGNYPDSLLALNFSGPAEVQTDLQKMQYRQIPSGYELSSQTSDWVITSQATRTGNERHLQTSRTSRVSQVD